MSANRIQKRPVNCSKDDSEAQNKIVTSYREGFEKIKYEEVEAEIEKLICLEAHCLQALGLGARVKS